MKNAFPFIIAAICGPAIAQENRQLDAHEHGVGELNIAIDGNEIAMELHAPGADIVGFEYEAKSAEDRAAIDDAVALLARPLDLFVLPAAAECTVTQASAELESEEAHDDHAEHDDEHAHDDHGDEHEDHAAEHDDHAAEHDDHKDEHKHEEHAEADDHAHDDHGDEAASHTEFHAAYMLNCGNPDALSEISFAYFETFENARELEVQIVSASAAKAFEVEREEPTLDLRGMF